MKTHPLVIGLLYAGAAVALTLMVVFPVFYVINLLYNDGSGMTPLLIATVAAWVLLAWLLRRRRIRL